MALGILITHTRTLVVACAVLVGRLVHRYHLSVWWAEFSDAPNTGRGTRNRKAPARAQTLALVSLKAYLRAGAHAILPDFGLIAGQCRYAADQLFRDSCAPSVSNA